jgi:hypothetical protein
VEGGDPDGVGDGLAEVPRGELGAGDRGRRNVGEGALPGGLDPRVGAVAQREEDVEELGGSDQPALAVLAALAALAATPALREGAAFFGRARRSALFR